MPTVRLRIVCDSSPPADHDGLPTEFGLQRGRDELAPGMTAESGAVVFEFEVTARPSPSTAKVDFYGPYVNGVPGARFVYLSYRTSGESSGWIRRLKIQLGGIDDALVAAVEQMPGGALEAHVSGIGSGTVPLIGGGWSVAQT